MLQLRACSGSGERVRGASRPGGEDGRRGKARTQGEASKASEAPTSRQRVGAATVDPVPAPTASLCVVSPPQHPFHFSLLYSLLPLMQWSNHHRQSIPTHLLRTTRVHPTNQIPYVRIAYTDTCWTIPFPEYFLLNRKITDICERRKKKQGKRALVPVMFTAPFSCTISFEM